MSCSRCVNTRVRVDRSSRAIVAGQTSTSVDVQAPDLPAYYEPVATDYTDTQLGRIASRRALLVVEHDDIDPHDKIIHLDDNNREYTITDYKKFGDHYELLIEEVRFGN